MTTDVTPVRTLKLSSCHVSDSAIFFSTDEPRYDRDRSASPRDEPRADRDRARSRSPNGRSDDRYVG